MAAVFSKRSVNDNCKFRADYDLTKIVNSSYRTHGGGGGGAPYKKGRDARRKF